MEVENLSKRQLKQHLKLFFILYKFKLFKNSYDKTNDEYIDGDNEFTKTNTSEIGWVTTAKDWAGELISGRSISGRILMIFVVILSVGSTIIYFIDASTL